MPRELRTSYLWALSIGILVALASVLGFLDRLELGSLDYRFTLRGPRPPKHPIVIVAIDQDSFNVMEVPWPWPRAFYAKAVDNIAKDGARAIGFDILFTEQSRIGGVKDDQALAAAIKRAGGKNVVLAATYSTAQMQYYKFGTFAFAVKPLSDVGSSGFIDMPRDGDGFIRKGVLRLADPEFGTQYSWAVALGREFGSSSPLLNRGGVVQINFRGPEHTFLWVPFYQVYNGEFAPGTFKDKIVLLGVTSPVEHDRFPAPFAAGHSTDPSKPSDMAGTEIQANFIDTLLANDPLVRPRRFFSLVILLALALGMGYAVYRLRPVRGFVLALGVAIVYVVLLQILFSNWDVWLDAISPMAGMWLAYGGLVVRNYIREEREKKALSRFFSPSIVQEIVKAHDQEALSAHRKKVTVLFSDIRGFTTISEGNKPETIVELLGEYFTQATDIIYQNGGTVDKFIGDAIMAIFGAPVLHEDDAARAVRAAIAMQRKANELAPQWVERCGRSLRIGVGIHTGEAVVGVMGSQSRLEYSAIGDTVNLASRLEGLTKELHSTIVVSEATYGEIKDGEFKTRPLSNVRVKGREAPVAVYGVAFNGEDWDEEA